MSMAPPIRRLWWLEPARLFAVVVGITILAAAVQSDAAYRLYGTPKYVATMHVLLAVAAIIVFSLGAWWENRGSEEPQSTPPESDRVVRFWFRLAFVLTLLGYLIWGAVGVKNGFSLHMFVELVTDADTYAAEETVRKELFPTIPGVTTCTHFNVVVVMLGVWLYLRGQRRVLWPMAIILALSVIQAMLWRERTAIIALVLPAIVVWLRAFVLTRPLSSPVRIGLKLGPVIGFVLLLLFFGGFEYFRSWQIYKSDFSSFSEFTLWRVGGYFTTAHNNGAMALETQSPLPLPYWTLQPLWEFPGMRNAPIGYYALTGLEPSVEHLNMLAQYGTVELNNEGGLFMPFVDYGLFGYLIFWFVSGFLAGKLYRFFLAGTLAGIVLYPIVFLSILNVPLILYIFFPASFPPLVMLLVVLWRARRAAKSAQTVETFHSPYEFHSLFKKDTTHA